MMARRRRKSASLIDKKERNAVRWFFISLFGAMLIFGARTVVLELINFFLGFEVNMGSLIGNAVLVVISIISALFLFLRYRIRPT